MKIRFFFDYLSPFAYLSSTKLPILTQRLPNLEIEFVPILFKDLVQHWGQKRTSEIPPKRSYIFTQCLRIATENEIPFTVPKYHPFDSTLSLCLSLKEISGQQQSVVISALWKAGWQEGKNLECSEVLLKTLAENKLPEDMLRRAMAPETLALLKENTALSISLGVFGIPTFLTPDNTLFWGYDSLSHLEKHLKNEEKIDRKHLVEILSRKNSIFLSSTKPPLDSQETINTERTFKKD